MALYGHIRLLSVLLGTFLSFCLLLYECKKLDGYKFPVYSTELCPRNQTKWNERSSAINCTKDNGYLCFPNEKFTQLLEFCHRARFIWIQEGYCLYLRKDDSTIYSYSCSSFQSGCHNSSFPSYDLFKHSSCTSIGNGCFLAEPFCRDPNTTTSPRETTKPIHVENVTRNYSITVSTDEKTNPPKKSDNSVIYNEVFMMPILAGVLISITIFCMLCFIYRKGYHICKRKIDIESPGEEENKPLILTNDQNKMPMETKKEESPHDRAIFEQWQEDNRQFVSTRACKEVEKLIKSQNLVVVTGNSGSGKSAIIQHIALSYRSDGWTVKPVYSVKEIMDAWSGQDALDRRTLLVFNDPIGNESFDEEKNKLWKDHEERLKGCLKKTKMLVSCRRYILNDARVRRILKDTSYACNIDLSDDQHKLDNEEKRKIFARYSSKSVFLKEDIIEIIKTDEYFPLLCKLYFNNKNKREGGLQFFKEPVQVCKDEINYFRKECKAIYCALVLLVLCNNQLCVEDIQEKDCLKEKFEIALKLCEMKRNTAPHTIGDALKTLEGFFVKKIDDTYHFYHDFVMEVTTYVFGTDYPRKTVQYADIGFLRRRVTVKGSNDNREEMKLENGDNRIDKFTICLNDDYVRDLGERLFNEIFGERMLDVVLNPCMKDEEVATCFIQKLKDSPGKLNELLAKKQIRQEFVNQEDNQALKQSFDSKLDFLYLEDEVPILSAIIVFCHTNISKHCLETIKRMPNSLKDTSLFSAVCCNGSIDLFNVFPKEQIKILLMETWGKFYPIHIVSLFHNHEILREMIQVKNEVNLRTRRGYGYTPLMLAAFNTDTSEQKTKESRIQSIDITMELLLNYGADINVCHESFSPRYKVNRIVYMKDANVNNIKSLYETRHENFCVEGQHELGSPLHVASNKGDDHTVKLLLDNGADVNLRDIFKESPLHNACNQGHTSTVKLLLDNGADVNLGNKSNTTPLDIACMQGHNSTVQLLLDNGTDINSCDRNKETPLHKASRMGNDSTVQFLLDKGANIHSCDANKETPLHKACEIGNESTVQLLLDKGADINLCDANNETPLHKASESGNESTVRLLLDKGANINLCDANNQTPLHKAFKGGKESTVQILLDKGADIYSCDINNETPLHKASGRGHDSTVQLLLDKGANINSCDANKETPLHKAIDCGHESTVQLLLDKGADINLCDTNKDTLLCRASFWGTDSSLQLLLDKGANINSCDANKETSLHKAIDCGHESTVQLLLDKGADINLCDTKNETPLHKASRMGNDSTVQLLLDKGANINSCNANNETPLHKAICFDAESTVQLLLDKGANVNSCDENEETPLHIASICGHVSTVQLLLEKGADINSSDTNKETPLHKASKLGCERTVQLLLEKGADINSCDTNKETPLHKASERGRESIVELLLDNGADINSCDTNKETPLHIASKWGLESTVQLLLDKGADINSSDTNEETPLHRASKRGHESTVQLLFEKGADINSCDTNKETPLHKASKGGHKSTVQFLLDKKANINSCDTNKETPLHKACQSGNESIVQILLDKGADINSCDADKETPLHKASGRGHDSMVKLLVDNGADINSCDTNNETPLHKASGRGHDSTVQFLLDKRANINSCDANEETPLHKASAGGHESTVQLLLDKGAEINSCDTNKETPLYKASEC